MKDPVCFKCGSEQLWKNGRNGCGSLRFKCKQCNNRFTVQKDDMVVAPQAPKEAAVVVPKLMDRFIGDHKRIVITSAIGHFPVDGEFFGALKNYCQAVDAKLGIIRVSYKNDENAGLFDEWPDDIKPYLMDANWVHDKGWYKIIGKCVITATAVSPLSGMDPLTQGVTTLLGHPQLQMRTLPVNKGKQPVILSTTGTISYGSGYSETKTGFKAEFAHTISAIVIENDEVNDCFHLRHLVADETGSFIDLNKKFTATTITDSQPEALVLGDEHVVFIDPKVNIATFTNQYSINKTLKPKKLVRHDVLDCFAVSHHHANDFFKRYSKANRKLDSIEDELKRTLTHLVETTEDDQESLIISSNHNNHLKKWLNVADPKHDIRNAKIYHALMWMCLDAIEKGNNADPFELYVDDARSDFELSNLRFIREDETHEICGINVGMHGDHGPNGSRGSRSNLSKLGEKSVIGHSHSPGIEKGCWQVGTSSKMNLEYAIGPSSWMHTHCLIHPNGQRQLISIVNGKWRL